MKIFLIGEAANNAPLLEQHLTVAHEIVPLPHATEELAELDATIEEQDVVVSLRFKHTPGGCSPTFRLLHVPGAGTDGIDFDSLPAKTEVCNVFEHEIPIAEYVLMSMLEWQIRPQAMRAAFDSHRWPEVYRNRPRHEELFGRTLGLIGFGRIGRAISEKARAFGMHIIAVDTKPGDPGSADELVAPSSLDHVLAAADFVVVACPLTEETHGLLDVGELRRMKASSVLINVSRAHVVAEEALYNALKTETIAGAILDVWYQYPGNSDDTVTSPSTFPFDTLPNVVCTPHSSAWTWALPKRRYAFIAENINRLCRGEPLLNVVRGPQNDGRNCRLQAGEER